ncbi:MAG: hypothetical protein IPL40_11665 [Proteobacteria bacterium]|nr:hypothetical protein [Pseudomonadota bacterium]
MSLQVLFHGNCFDGAVSAAVFWRFYRERIDPRAVVSFRGMSHGQGDPYGADHAACFNAEENAVLDFRYSPSPRLGWFCDHHQSAFLQPADRDHFAADRSGRKCFDPQAPSCAGLLARWLAREHGFDPAPLAEQLRWADLIDSARFESPAQAVRLESPALQLMALLEQAPPQALVEALIQALAAGTLAQARALPAIAQAVAPVLEQQAVQLELLRRRIEVQRGVATFDLSADGVEGFNKFVPYYLHEGLRYTVGLTASPRRAKVSVGSNPWQRPEPLTNLAELCAPWGGGGHAVVAGISLPPEQLDRARAAAEAIAAHLRATAP